MRTTLIAAVLTAGLLSTTGLVAADAAPTSAKSYKNCKALNQDYPHGVGKKGAKDKTKSGNPVTNFKVSNSLYKANKKRDADKDGIACEKH